MARTPVAPDLNRRILRMEEEIRQLRLRRPTGAAAVVDPWHSLTPYLDTGWINYGDGPFINSHFARFRLEGPRVWLAGTVLNESAGDGSLHPIGAMPPGYAVAVDNSQADIVIFESPDGSDFNTGAYWAAYVEATQISLYESPLFYTGSPSFGGVPEGKALCLDGINYSVVLANDFS